MKKINFIILILFTMLCKAQSPVKSLYDDRDINGAYYKDIYNDFDKFIGTWKYTNGSTSLTITLQKKVQYHKFFSNGDDYYLDVMVGEYKYIENGVEKINTLPFLFQNFDDPYKYNIAGSLIARPNSIYCLGCGPNDRKLVLQFSDPTREIEGYEPQMMFQRADSGGVQKLKLIFRTISGMIVEEGVEPPYSEYTVPFGEYLLVKQ
ncbi:DUF6705 family protein [Flavobacterium cerinum]|uniref:DUF6705 domain-containing protein n=1 Tax=Flavobacterium cerinum TaxID=2502784 RepID=A0A444HC88_9FLAO|nr:DUF6705 family protein [Flavobacterium cerinum]RWX01055.1 hypothetical protein EPI11_08520 [Flavobacterium cerinum]